MTPLVRTAAIVASILLSACGSDGGGSMPAESDAPIQSGDPAPAESSLVPSAPAPGDLLYARAPDLRPLRHDAVWTYRGRDFILGTVFANTVRQQGIADTVAETHSQDPAMQLTYSLSSHGDVMQRGRIALPWSGKALEIDAIELPTPVRLNAQWTLFDRALDDIGVDVDGDRLNDGARIGVYSRVVGNEDVSLPNKPLLRALRVDTHVAVALRLSSGRPSAPTERVLSTWYAAGIGPVRQALRSTDASREFDREQVLLTWDGVTEGLGYFAQGLVFPPGTGALAGTPVPPSRMAVALEDGALVLTDAGDGVAVHRLDRRGALVSTHLYPASGMFSSASKFLRLRSGPRLVSYTDTGIELYAFTEDGVRVGDAPLASLPGIEVAAALGSDGMWVETLTDIGGRDFGTGRFRSYEVILQRFTEEGHVLGAPVPTRIAFSSGIMSAYLFSRSTSLVASDSAAVVHSFDGRFSMVSSQATIVSSPPDFRSYPKALADRSSHWIAWVNVAPPDAVGTTRRPHGARLDANGAYVLDATGDLAKQAIEALDADASAGWPEGYAALEGHLVGIGFTAGGTFWPEDAAPSDWLTLRDLDARAPVLSTGAKLVAQVRVPSEGVYASVSGPPLLLRDRALLLGQKDGQLQSIVVWRR